MEKGYHEEAMTRVKKALLNCDSLLRAFPSIDSIEIASKTWKSVLVYGDFRDRFMNLYNGLLLSILLELSSKVDYPPDRLTALWILFRSGSHLPLLPESFTADIWNFALIQFRMLMQSDKMEPLLSSLSHDDISPLINDIHHYIANQCHCQPTSSRFYDHSKTNLFLALDLMKGIYDENLKAEDPVPFKRFYSELVTEAFAPQNQTHYRSLILKYPFAVHLSLKRNVLRENPCHQAVHLWVNRESLMNDALNAAPRIRAKSPYPNLQITFKGEFGYDLGGLKREFFNLFCENLSPDYFHRDDDDARKMLIDLTKNVDSDKYHNIGIIIASAFHQQVPLNLNFPKFFYNRLLGLPVVLRDLLSYDENMYKAMQKILNPSLTAEGLVECSAGYFENEDDDPITLDNRVERVETLLESIVANDQINQLSLGFNSAIGDQYKSLLNPDELEILLCGVQTIDHADLKQHTVYSRDGDHEISLRYSEHDPVIQNLWEVLSEFDQPDMVRLVQFVTGTSRLPPGGAANLDPPMMVQPVPPSWSTAPVDDQLPGASTCYNQLILPPYSSKAILSRKLRQALEHCQGFGLD
eukprot:CRZ05846.1 hypothetical protein [Spongospora subterranea]